MRVFSARIVGLVLPLTLLTASSASAQLFEIARENQAVAISMNSDAAYDPVHDCYFVLTGDPLTGQFLDRSGRAIGPAITLDTVRSFFASATVYSPDISDGAGGRGGFLVVWGEGTLFAQVVTFPGRLVGARRIIPHQSVGGHVNIDAAYSPIERTFLVGLVFFKTSTLFDAPARLISLDLNAQPIGESALSSDPNYSCFFEALFTCSVHVEWNPVSSEFGVLYPQGVSNTDQGSSSQRVLARVTADGTILSRTNLGLPVAGSDSNALGVNTHTGNYLALVPSATASVYGVELGPNGDILARGPVSGAIQFEFDGTVAGPWKLRYSPASGTFLLGGRQRGSTGIFLQLNQHGVPMSSTFTSVDWWFGAAAHPTNAEWLVARSTVTSIIGTNAQFGGSAAVLPDCLTSDPFASLGGGRCVNRGWLPPGHPLIPPGPPPPPPPPPPSGVCTIPDPFTSLGGGVCVNGGWVPRGHPLAGGGL